MSNKLHCQGTLLAIQPRRQQAMRTCAGKLETGTGTGRPAITNRTQFVAGRSLLCPNSGPNH